MSSAVAKCPRCDFTCEFKHYHDTAHGIEGTHMAGTERFVCTQCGNAIYHHDKAASQFKFILDGKTSA